MANDHPSDSMRVVRVRDEISARRLLSILLTSAGLTLATIAVFLVLLFTRPHNPSAAWITVGLSILYTWIGLAAVTAVILMVDLRVVRRELVLGYTTTRGFPDTVMVDSRTGAVLREAGAPMLSRAETRAARARAKAWILAHPDQNSTN